MDHSNLQNPSGEQSISELRESIRGLRTLFHVAVVALIVLSGSQSVYLMKQLSLVRRQAAELDAYVGGYETNARPKIEKFMAELGQFTKTNPDFAPILNNHVQGMGQNSAAAPAMQPPPGGPGR